MNKHAELINEYAKDWASSSEPWTKWQFKEPGRPESLNNSEWNFWRDLTSHPSWQSSWDYRRKPDTFKFNGKDIPVPIKSTDTLLPETLVWYVRINPPLDIPMTIESEEYSALGAEIVLNGKFFYNKEDAEILAEAYKF